MGNMLYRLEIYEEALSCYDKVLEKDAESLDALINKGHALFNLKIYEEAISCYDKALKLTTGYSLLSNNRLEHK